MLGSTALEVAIGMAFVYLLLSMICSALNEMVAGWFKLRAKKLAVGLRHLLDDPERLAKLYGHPLIKGFTQDGKPPSYIPARAFTTALVDILMPADPAAALPKQIADLRRAVAGLPDGQLRKALAALIDEAGNDLTKARQAIAQWFDDAMERVSGWYRRQAHWILLGLAATVTAVLNVDTVTVSTALARDNALRAAVVASAEKMTQQPPAATASPQPGAAAVPVMGLDQLNAQIDRLQLPLGWREWPKTTQDWLAKIAGLLVTTIAVSLGAPFWFDLLNKLVNLRSGGAKPARADAGT